MNCEQFREVVHDVARDESLGFDALREALDHAEHCRECDALLEEAEALTAKLHAVAKRFSLEAAPQRVEAALVHAFREQKKPVPRASRIRLWAFSAAGSLAAAILLAFVVMHDHKPAPVGTAAIASRTVAVAAKSGASANFATDTFPAGEGTVALTTDSPEGLTQGWPVAYEDSVGASSFVPLSDTFDPSTLDMNSVVRVAMSRPALERLGVYLDDLDGDGVVVADLVLSGDGTPQAIRVVRW